jgi:hypothetical protein
MNNGSSSVTLECDEPFVLGFLTTNIKIVREVRII